MVVTNAQGKSGPWNICQGLNLVSGLKKLTKIEPAVTKSQNSLIISF